MTRVGIALGAGLALIGLAAPQAGASVVLWDNGPVVDADSGGPCDQGPSTGCGGSGTWTYYDNFSLAGDATVTGFSYTDWFNTGNPGNYVQTNWSLFAGDPFTTAPLAAGGVVAVLSPTGPAGQYLFSVPSGLSIFLPAGDYWLGINNLVTDGIVTTAATVALIDGSKQSDGVFNADHASEDRAFTVYGDSAVPEPGTMLLLGSGLLGLAARRRRTS